MGEFNLIIIWLVLCGYNTDFTDSIMLLRQGGLLNNSMTERLSVQVQSKQEPESFFSPHEPYSVLKPTFMKKYKQLSGSFISVKTVLVNCRDKVCTVTYIFMYAPNVLGPSLTAFCKHSHMWEWTSRHACLNVNTLSAPAGLVRSRNCSSRAAVPCGLRAGTRWTGGRTPNWPEWLQSEPIRDKRWIALQIGSDSIVLCDRATIALLTKQRTGVQALPLRWPSEQPRESPATAGLTHPEQTHWTLGLLCTISFYSLRRKSISVWQACSRVITINLQYGGMYS